MTPTRLKFIFAAIMLSTTVAGPCAAGVIAYDNLPPAPFNPQIVSGIGTVVGYGITTQSAQRFTPASSGRLATLDLPIYFQREGSADDLTLTIVSDANGLPTATELWSQTYIDKVRSHRFEGVYLPALSFEVENGVTLQAGTTYWLIATANPVYAQYRHFWAFTPTASVEPRALNNSNTNPNFPDWPVGEWFVRDGTLGLRVTVIPEPATAALMLAASATLLAMRRRRVL